MTEAEGYVRLCHAVEAAILYAREIELPESDWRPAVEAEIAELEIMRDRVIEETRAADRLSEEARNAIIQMLNDVLEEVRLVLKGGAGGSKEILGPDGNPVGPVTGPSTTPRTGPGWGTLIIRWINSIKPSRLIIGLITLVVGPPVGYVIWKKALEPSEAEKVQEIINNIILADLRRCGADQDCKMKAIERGEAIRIKALGIELDNLLTGGKCDLLDTPLPTVIGMLFGIGLGYSGMRSIMRW